MHLPALRQGLAAEFAGPAGGKLLLVGSQGFEGDAVVACVALKMQMTGCSCHQALTDLLHQNSTLAVSLLVRKTNVSALLS